MKELAILASKIYKGNPLIEVYENRNCLTYIPCTAESLGLPEPAFYLWSGEEGLYDDAYFRYFTTTYSNWSNGTRTNSNFQAVCLGD